MPRFFVAKEFIKTDTIYITGLEAHHILDVMRLKISDEVIVFDGTGREYTGIIKAANRKSLEVEIKKTRESDAGKTVFLTLIQAIPKKDKMDYIAEKATELGVTRIIPVTTARTIPEWNDAKKASVVGRWRKIAMEAAKQCGRADIPEIQPITDFNAVVGAAARSGENDGKAARTHDLKLIAALSDKAIKLKDALKNGSGKKITVAIGPEGDFTPEEIERAKNAGFRIISLGPRVLKSDTAGLALLSMVNYEYEN
ncbi:MAG: 16S rRNA (uracil(1498)-N(3))-methyltransferase [Candidatus Omnitrophica bacterium]|nr:16S rRNA (uracil(1498)-N(3))-methyltransferase [Candidatus Omnitrophota bacterium]